MSLTGHATVLFVQDVHRAAAYDCDRLGFDGDVYGHILAFDKGR